MLSKSVCQSCTVHHKYMAMNPNFSSRWEEHSLVLCPTVIAGNKRHWWECLASVSKSPPHWCPSKFEHGVASVLDSANVE